jgi:hypothetical protein
LKNDSNAQNGDLTTNSDSKSLNDSENKTNSNADNALSSSSESENQSKNDSSSCNEFDHDTALNSSAHGTANAANNAANTISHGNKFTVGNNTIVNVNESFSLPLMMLFLDMMPKINFSRSNKGHFNNKIGDMNKLEGSLEALLEQERQRTMLLVEILRKQNNTQ